MKYYIKDKDLTWPSDPVFYILAKEGLFKCRNHRFFRSCVLVSGEESNLEGLLPQKEICSIKYPKIPAWFLRDTVAFFYEAANRHKAEAIVLLGYDMMDERWVAVVPDQTSGGMEVKYKIPDDIGESVVLLGDIHSHVDSAAFHSGTDIHDEKMRDGLHVTFGRVRDKVPEVSVEMVQDGTRFKVDPDDVLEEFEGRSTKTPDGWMDKFTYKPWRYDGGGGHGYHTWDGYDNHQTHGHEQHKPKKGMKRWLRGFGHITGYE